MGMVRVKQSAKQIWVAIAATLVTSAVVANETTADFEANALSRR